MENNIIEKKQKPSTENNNNTETKSNDIIEITQTNSEIPSDKPIKKLLINKYLLIGIACIVIFLLFYFNIIPNFVPIQMNFSNVKTKKKSEKNKKNDNWDINKEISNFMNKQDEYIQSYIK